MPNPNQIVLDSATATVITESFTFRGSKKAFQAFGSTSSGSGSAKLRVQASNDNENWMNLGDIDLNLTTTVSTDGFTIDATWPYYRFNLSSLSGTGAAVSAWASTL